MVVVDTNVILSGCRSRNGASFLLVRGKIAGEIEFAASPSLVLEYDDVLNRPGLLGAPLALSPRQIEILVDALRARAVQVTPWFRFRPFLDDPKDDMVIECALAAGARIVVTRDKDFNHSAVGALGLRAMSPSDYLWETQQERTKR